ncbi:hypothetical protein ORJ04_22195 [Rheinheimera baltica]|uniref:Uncharacterized protein n=1 Tax=Rheinheimera baltica TaxID=67576 RepID=A0ABT9I5K2_9GAMM|nr:hypothetical protein [Rheinheimera baltica]MDP5138662.1 hypothetical protein [Rheinheimera baltica]MDP5151746.1 hypothetical protein [Rheinheimera baltica]
MNKIEMLLAGLASVMLLPLYISITGMRIYYDSGNPVNHEGLEIVAYMLLYSSVLWLPYLVVSVIFFNRVGKSILAGSSVPFLATGFIALWLFI